MPGWSKCVFQGMKSGGFRFCLHNAIVNKLPSASCAIGRQQFNIAGRIVAAGGSCFGMHNVISCLIDGYVHFFVYRINEYSNIAIQQMDTAGANTRHYCVAIDGTVLYLLNSGNVILNIGDGSLDTHQVNSKADIVTDPEFFARSDTEIYR